MDQNLDFVVHTFGCKVNTYDSGLIQKNMDQNGYHTLNKIDKNKAQIHILNTCAVTAEATQEAVKVIRKIKTQQPFATVVVTGCSAQVDTGVFENLPGADLVVANSHKGMLPFLLNQYFKKELKQKVFKSNIFKKEDLESGGGIEQHHTRSFLKIQDGCNSFCSFCIIPYARGKSRSIPVFDLVKKIKELENQGVNEIVLTGVHIGDYLDESQGAQFGLTQLVESVLRKTKINRIRLSSLEPVELTDDLLDLYSDSRLCPHFHMSIQSANTQVLSDMKRKYNQQDVVNALNRIYKKLPNPFVGMDVIAGFPTETEEFFEDTYKTLSEVPWTKIHVFPYSERQGTRATTFEQIPFHLRKERAAQLRQLSHHRYQAELIKQIGQTENALILNKKITVGEKKLVEGLTRNYWPVYIDDNHDLQSGQEQNIKISSIDSFNGEQILRAEVLRTQQAGLSL